MCGAQKFLSSLSRIEIFLHRFCFSGGLQLFTVASLMSLPSTLFPSAAGRSCLQTEPLGAQYYSHKSYLPAGEPSRAEPDVPFGRESQHEHERVKNQPEGGANVALICFCDNSFLFFCFCFLWLQIIIAWRPNWLESCCEF